MSATTCPSHDELLAYSLGRLPDEASDAIAAHLSSCLDCKAGLPTLDHAEDTFLARLRRPATPDPYLEESQCQVALAQARAVSGRSSPAGRSNQSLCGKALGEYQLIEELGQGGMGTVYKALHTKLDRVVAVKVLPRGRLEDPQAIARFEREMKAVGRLVHPNIVQAYDAREIDGTPVLIMEFVDGLDLAELVRRIGPLPAAEACELVRQTALGLQRAHEHGLVHRDIKPSNIMLTGMRGEGLGARGENLIPRPSSLVPHPSPLVPYPSSLAPPQVKLLDLGLARFYAEASGGEEMTGTGQAMGTADYMAPEQASDSRTVDIRADIYSLGCTLYKLLSGRAPFSGPEHRGTLDKMNAHVHESPPPIRQFAPDVPDELAAILDRMLAKDPNDRFATPAEVAAILEPFCTAASLLSLWEKVRARDEQAESSPPSNSARAMVSDEEAELSPLSLRERVRVRAASSAPIPRRPTIKTLLIGLGFLGGIAAAFVAGVLITINKNGEKYQVEVPKDSHTVVDDSGNVTVNIPGKPQGGKASAANPAVEFQALQGRWRVVRVEKGKDGDASWAKILGYDFGEENPAAFDRLHFTENRLTIKNLKDGTGTDWDYRIDPTATPKTIDLLTDLTPGATRLNAVGVYEIHGDRLTICLAKYLPSLKTDQRPTRLVVGPDSGDVLFVLQRYRLSADEKAIEGFWGVASQVDDGKPVPEEKLRRRSCQVFEDNIGIFGMTADGKPDNVLSGPYELGPTKHPKTIRIVTYYDYENKKFERREVLGIYKLEGDRLTIAYRKGTSPPEKFESLPGSGVTLLVLQKKEPGPELYGGMEAAKPEHGPDGVPEGETAKATTFRTATVTRGDIVATVSATGTVEPEEVVDVGAKVAGQIVSLGDDPRGATDPRYKGKSIDFDTPVEKGRVLARIDDAIYRARVDQEQAGLARARAELAVAEAKREPVDVARATILAAQAAIQQSEGALRVAQINLANTVIQSPIKGVILARRVNVGQNVAPDPKAPSLFLIAKDLKKGQVWASVNEADISRIHEGMEARFTVDAVPKETFKGKVAQVRLNAQMTQNVVLYTVVVTFDNADLKLRPYMTANLQFETASARNVLRVPNTALRWKPRPDQVAPDARESAPTAEVRRSRARVWAKDKDGEHVRPLEVQFGVSDGSMTEVSGPEVKEGMEVVVGEGPSPAATGKQPAPAAQTPKTPTAVAVSPAAELKALQGPWKVVRLERGNRWGSTRPAIAAEFPPDPAAMYRFDFGESAEGHTLRLRWFDPSHNQEWVEEDFHFRADPTAVPRTIDLLEFGLEAVGIYEIDGNRMSICLRRYLPSAKGDQRPKVLTIRPDSEDLLVVLERYRPSEDERAILGDWTVVGQVEAGKPISEEKLRDSSFSIGDRSFHINDTIAHRMLNVIVDVPYPSALSVPYVLDASKQPKRITIFAYEGEERKRKRRDLLGIYKLDGDRLSIAYRQGGPPPEKFESLPGSGVTLLVLQRREEPKAASSPKPDKAEARKVPSRQESDVKPAKAPTARAEPDREAILSLLREKAQRLAKAMRTGQPNYKSIERRWRPGAGEKRSEEPSIINTQGRVYFDDYSFGKVPANVFTLYHLSLSGAVRLHDERKGPTTGNWYNLPPHGNLADPNGT
jgi:uncharacterized protein (TIGR03067 family)